MSESIDSCPRAGTARVSVAPRDVSLFDGGSYCTLFGLGFGLPHQDGRSLWERLRAGSIRREQTQRLDAWLADNLRACFLRHAFTDCKVDSTLRVPHAVLHRHTTPPLDVFAVLRSSDGARAGVQFGERSFSFDLRALHCLELRLPDERDIDAPYLLRLHLGAASESACETLSIALPGTAEMRLSMLETTLLMAGLLRVQLAFGDGVEEP
jgi:hypothetical protein